MPPTLSLRATAADFRAFSKRCQALLATFAAEANSPDQSRLLRTIPKREGREITGLSERRWLALRPPMLPGQGANVTLAQLHAMQEQAGVRPRRPPGSRPMRLAVSGFKGGSSKTLTALHLSHYLAFHGWRVLVVDSDPQGTLSRMFDFFPERIDPSETIAVVFSGDGSVPRPQRTHIDGLDFIPASLQMIGADIELAKAFRGGESFASRFYALVDDALTQIEDPYDIVLFDSAPAFSFAAITVLWAANALLVPLAPAIADFSATGDYAGMVGDVALSLDRAADRTKTWNPVMFVLSRTDGSLVAESMHKLNAQQWGTHFLPESIPSSSAFQQAQLQLRSVYEMTASQINSRSLRRAREAMDALGASVVRQLLLAWREQQLGDAAQSATL